MGRVVVFGLFVFLCFSSVYAGANYQDLAHDYYRFQKAKQTPVDPCTPRTSCFKTACDLIDRFECDDMSEQENIRNACRGVWGGECVTVASQLLGRFEFDDNEEMVQLVTSCRGVYDLECVRYSCGRLGRMGCDDLEEVLQVNRSCASAHPYYN